MVKPATIQLEILDSTYTEDLNGNRKFTIKIEFSTGRTLEREWFLYYVQKNPTTYLQLETLDGIKTSLSQKDISINWSKVVRGFVVYPVNRIDFEVTGKENLPNNIMKGTIYMTADRNPVSNTISIQKTLQSQIPESERNQKGQSVFTSQPTTTLGSVITNIADTIIPSIPEAQASGIYAPDITTPTISATVPESATIGFDNVTENSVLIFWNPHGDGGSRITSYYVTLKNEDTGQTILQQIIGDPRQPSPPQTNLFVQNLDSGTNYKAYVIVINAIGNSFEQSYGFKTLGLTPTTPITPVIIPDGFHEMPDGSIMADSDMIDFIIESDGKVRVIRLTGSNAGEEIKLFPASAQINIDRGYVRLLTAQERAGIVTPEPEATFCVNTYNIRDSGSVYSTHYQAITAQKVEELQKSQFVVSCEATTLPSEKEVQDFYGFTPLPPAVDTSINSTMVSQSVGAFILKDGRLKGEILYIANQSFNPFYYGKNLTSLVQIKSKTGVSIVIKPNDLNFTQTERDERIQIDEAVGNFKELLIDFFVWDSPVSMLIFSDTKQIQVVEELPPTNGDDDDKFKPCQMGFHKDFSGKCVPDDPLPELPRDKLIDTLKGFLFGTVALSLLARKY